MSRPTVYELMPLCDGDVMAAMQMIDVMRGAYDRDGLAKHFESARDRERECYRPPALDDLQLTVLNHLTQGFGVEPLGTNLGRNLPNADDYAPQYSYVNQGDVYATTIIRNNYTGRYFIGTVGDLVESGDVRESQ